MSTFVCPLFDEPKEFEDVLPTYADVIRFCLLRRKIIMEEKNSSQEPSFKNIAAYTTNKIQCLYKQLRIPTVTRNQVIQMILDYHKKYMIMKGDVRNASNSTKIEQRIKNFKDSAIMKLFDICACKCSNFVHCTCHEDKKIPLHMQNFILDQRRSSRHFKFSIASLNIPTGKAADKENGVNEADITPPVRPPLGASIDKNRVDSISQRHDDLKRPYADSDQENDDPMNYDESEIENVPPQSLLYNTVKLTNTALVSDRFHVSLRATAAIANAILLDYQVINNNNTSFIVDKNKIARAKKK